MKNFVCMRLIQKLIPVPVLKNKIYSKKYSTSIGHDLTIIKSYNWYYSILNDGMLSDFIHDFYFN
jgi:hypothetical protein